MRTITPRPRRRRHLLAVAAITAVLAGTIAACGSDEPAALQGVQRTPPLVVSGATMPDVRTGDAFDFKASPGGLLLVYFGYTSCPDICPTTLSDLRVAIDDLPTSDAERVDVAMATVDPERDTPEVVQQYLGHFFPDGHPLRSDDSAVNAEVQKRFGVVAEIAPHQPGDDYEVGHTALTYVVDDTGTVAVEWPFGMAPEAMTADLALLLDRAEAKASGA